MKINMKKAGVSCIVKRNLSKGISDDYLSDIVNAIIDDVVRDVDECADSKNWNEDDVKLAVGRVLCERLGIER